MRADTIYALLHEKLGIKKHIIALKLARQEPAAIEKYADMNNICYMMAEVLEENKVFYTTLENHVCLLGCAATGLDPALSLMSDDERAESDQFHTASINIFPDGGNSAAGGGAGRCAFPQIFRCLQGGYYRQARLCGRP